MSEPPRAAVDTVLWQFCKTCGEATVTVPCRRDGPPYQCCARHCCPSGWPDWMPWPD